MGYIHRCHEPFIPILVCIWVTCSSSHAHAQLANSPWPSYGNDARNTNYTPFVGPEEKPRIKWEFPTDGHVMFQPTITNDGGVVILPKISRSAELVVLNRDGSLRWDTTKTIGFVNWAANDISGGVHVIVESNVESRYLVYDQTTGDILQNILLGDVGPVQSGPAIAPDGRIYLTSQVSLPDPHHVWSFDPLGKENWVMPGGGYLITPAIDPVGNVIIGGREVRSYDPDGNLNWEFDTVLEPENASQFFSVAVDDDGNVFVGQYAFDRVTNPRPDKLFALDSDGGLRWTFDDAGAAVSLSPYGTVYATNQTTLYAIDRFGDELWHFEFGERGDASVSSEGVVIDGNGNVYLTNTEGILYSLDSLGNLRWTFDLAPNHNDDTVFPSVPIIDENGILYIGTGEDRRILALMIPEPTTISVLVVSLSLVSWNRHRRRHIQDRH